MDEARQQAKNGWRAMIQQMFNLEDWFLPKPKKTRTTANIGKRAKAIAKRRRLNHLAKVSRKMNRGAR